MELKNYFADASQSLFKATRDFFTHELQIQLGSITEKALPKERLVTRTQLLPLIDKIFFIGGVDEENFSRGDSRTFDVLKQEAKYEGMLLFAVELVKANPTRTELAEITRSLNRSSHMLPVVVVFRHSNRISIATCERTKYKIEWREGEKAGKVSLLYNINLEKPHSGHDRILRSLTIPGIREYDRKNKVTSFSDLHVAWRRVFNTDVLNIEFYHDYQLLSVQLIQSIHPKQIKNKLIAHQGVLSLVNRIMFVYFMQKKKWLMKDDNFIYHFWQEYLSSGLKDKFHEHWLNTLFFSAFNGRIWKAGASLKYFPEHLQKALTEFPFLNGGLFTKNDDCDDFILPDKYFHDIFQFFEGYIFTIDEDTPLEVNLEVNPVLLGKMYEGMINATDLNDVDAEHGIVYTERPEINFMVRRSLVEVLDKKLGGSVSREFLYHFIFDNPEQKKEILRRYKVNLAQLREAITSISACDPACGSGSMLLVLIQVQMEMLRVIDAARGAPHSGEDDFTIKKQLISDCLYGVDIKEWAVRIAELRLWLYMIAEAELKEDQLTKEPLLPNLNFKLRCGNSLLQKIGNLDFDVEELLKRRKRTRGSGTQALYNLLNRKKHSSATSRILKPLSRN